MPQVRFVGTKRGIEARVLPELGWELELIEVSGLKTVGVRGAIRGLFRLPTRAVAGAPRGQGVLARRGDRRRRLRLGPGRA